MLAVLCSPAAFFCVAQGPAASRKAHIRAFKGYAEEGYDKEKRVASLVESKAWTVAALKGALGMLGLERSGPALDLAARLVDYLAKPHTNVKGPVAGKSSSKARGTKRAAPAAGAKKGKKKRAAKPEGYPKGAVTAYFHFSKEMRPEVVAAHPGVAVTEVAKLLGERWRATEDKSKWQAAAAADKERFAAEVAAFHAKAEQA